MRIALWGDGQLTEHDRHFLATADDDLGRRREVVGTLQLILILNLSFRGGWRAQIEGVRTAAGCSPPSTTTYRPGSSRG